LTKYYFSRSMLETFQQCMFRGYLNYFTPGIQQALLGQAPAGMVRRAKAGSLLFGGAVHKGLEALFQGKGEDEAAGTAQELLLATPMVEDRTGQPVTSWVMTEHLALCEAILRFLYRIHFKGLQEEFSVEATEQELNRTFYSAPEEEFIFQSRADAVLSSKSEDRFGKGILSIKTTKLLAEDSDNQYATGSKVENQANIDMQGVSEIWAAESTYPDISWVQMLYLKKGERGPWKKKGMQDRIFYSNPLITGWKKTDISNQYAWAYTGTKADGSRTTLSAAQWDRFWCFEEFSRPEDPLGVKTWLGMLEEKQAWPFSDGLWYNGLAKIPPPIYRSATDQEIFVARTTSLAHELIQKYKSVSSHSIDDLHGKLSVISSGFFDNRRACQWPSICDYYEHCHKGKLIVDKYLMPDEQYFVPRNPNHPEE